MTDSAPTTPPGWYPDPNGASQQRYWDGSSWTDNVAPAAVPPPPSVYVSAGPTRSVAKVPVKTSHLFHLVMTILTAGIWGLFVWLPMTIINSMRKKKVVTRYE